MASSPDQQKEVESDIDPVAASNDAGVTTRQVRDTFRALARQIAVLVEAALRTAGAERKFGGAMGERS